MTYEQIAGVLDIRMSTVRVHARAGRETLRKLILQHDPTRIEEIIARSGTRKRALEKREL